MYFADDPVEVFGRRGRITRAVSGHPCISPIGFPETEIAEQVGRSDPEAQEEEQQEGLEECDLGDVEEEK